MAEAYRGRIIHFTDDTDSVQAPTLFDDGLLIVDAGKVAAVGPAQALMAQWPTDKPLQHFPEHLIMPGLIDCHVHFPQLDVIAAYGTHLLDWLNRYTFPAEARFADAEYAAQVAREFFAQLFAAGTTTAVAYCTVHKESVDAFFTESERLNARMIAGKVLMDRNAPPALLDSPRAAYAESRALIEQWHGRGRQLYALTPRFAPTSTAQQLHSVTRLRCEFPDVYLQTHLSESIEELAWVKELFPDAPDYLGVYEQYGLVNERGIFGHGIHLSDSELERLQRAGAVIAYCPTSNLFLGSGLFDLQRAQAAGVRVGIASDVGGGTSLSMLRTLSEAYKIGQLQQQSLHPFSAFYMATRGNARCLGLENKIGSFQVGNEADFIVVDPRAGMALDYRYPQCQTLEQQLFALMILGDDRVIERTYIHGALQYDKKLEQYEKSA